MSVRTRALALRGSTYRVSLSDMVVVVVDGVWTRRQRKLKGGVGGVNFGLRVCQRDEDASRGPGAHCEPTNTGGGVQTTTLQRVQEWRRRETDRGEIRRAFFL